MLLGGLISVLIFLTIIFSPHKKAGQVAGLQSFEEKYWFALHRKSNKELLYKGLPGNVGSSTLVKTFQVKSGVPGKKPTPLPSIIGRDYWLLTAAMPVAYADNPETAPYFLTLDVPVGEDPPYGPTPYNECDGQCDWEVPGAFGLHGVGGDISKLSAENAGSSGCIRHRDEDITYLYNLLDPEHSPIRYYVQDI